MPDFTTNLIYLFHKRDTCLIYFMCLCKSILSIIEFLLRIYNSLMRMIVSDKILNFLKIETIIPQIVMNIDGIYSNFEVQEINEDD